MHIEEHQGMLEEPLRSPFNIKSDCRMQLRVLDSFDLSSNAQFVMKLSRNYNLKGKVQIANHSLILKGILTHKNGHPLKISNQYAEHFQKMCKQNEKIVQYHYSITEQLLKIKIISPIKAETQFPVYNINQILHNLQNSVKLLESSLWGIGVYKVFNKKSLNIKQYQLILIKKTVSLLNNPSSLTKIELPVQTPAFKLCQVMKQIPDPPAPLSSLLNSQILTKMDDPFIIQKKLFEIKQCGAAQVSIKQVAVKQVNPLTSNKNKEKYQKKLDKQIQIINCIRDSKYTVNCWRMKDQRNCQLLCMDYVKNSLTDLIYFRYNSIADILNFCQQVVEGTRILHSSGIVHRDLKPDNILVQTVQNSYKLKIIDFGESALLSDQQKLKIQLMGHTMPYSPLECSYPGRQGIYRPQIDFWSVGLLIFEIAFKHIPISYSKSFAHNISKGWKLKDEFSLFCSLRKRSGIRKLQLIISLISLHSICIRNQERLNLEGMHQILNFCQQFIHNLSTA